MEKREFKGVPESTWVVGPCQTEEIAKQVLAVADAYGYAWHTGTSYKQLSLYREKKCYNLLEGTCGKLIAYKEFGWTIISPETFLANNPMPEEKKMETVGTIKGKKKFTLEEWKKEADAARKRAIYWKKQSDQWEGRFFLVQDSIGGEIEAINKKLESAETQLKWSHDANKELKASNIDLKGANDDMSEEIKKMKAQLTEKKFHFKCAQEANASMQDINVKLRGANDELAADGSKYRLDIKLLQEDLDIEKQFNERLQDDHNVLKNIQRHTALLGWAGWILFFVALFGMIFFKN